MNPFTDYASFCYRSLPLSRPLLPVGIKTNTHLHNHTLNLHDKFQPPKAKKWQVFKEEEKKSVLWRWVLISVKVHHCHQLWQSKKERHKRVKRDYITVNTLSLPTLLVWRAWLWHVIIIIIILDFIYNELYTCKQISKCTVQATINSKGINRNKSINTVNR